MHETSSRTDGRRHRWIKLMTQVDILIEKSQLNCTIQLEIQREDEKN